MRFNGIVKKIGFSLILLFSVSCTRSSLNIDVDIVEKRLSNGLKVVMVEDRAAPVITFQTWVKVGSYDEDPTLTGLAHLFEHLMFKGTKKYGPKKFFENLEAKGAEVNAFTTRDYTVYYQNFTPDLLETVVDMESDRLRNLIIDDKVLATERNVVYEERRLRVENSPAGKIQEALWRLAYERHPYKWPVIGYMEHLARAKVKDLKEFYNKFYQPSNASLVVVGDIETGKTWDLIKKYYGKIPSQEPPKKTKYPPVAQKSEKRISLYDHVASEKFAHAYRVSSADNIDSYSLDVLSNIMFSGKSSRAYRELVENQNLAIGIRGAAYTPTHPGLMIIMGTMKQKYPAKKIEQPLWELFESIQKDGVSKSEVTKAVRQLNVELVDAISTPSGLANMIGTVQTIFGDPERFSKDVDKYLSVTPESVQRVAKKYIHPNNRTVVIMKPMAAKKAEGKK